MTTQTVTVRLPAELVEAMDLHPGTRTETIRRALEAYLQVVAEMADVDLSLKEPLKVHAVIIDEPQIPDEPVEGFPFSSNDVTLLGPETVKGKAEVPTPMVTTGNEPTPEEVAERVAVIAQCTHPKKQRQDKGWGIICGQCGVRLG